MRNLIRADEEDKPEPELAYIPGDVPDLPVNPNVYQAEI